jgi:hypothetical protein
MLRRSLTMMVAAAATLLVSYPAGARSAGPAAAWSPAGSPVQTVFQTHAAFLSGKVYMPGGYLAGFTPYDKMQILATGSNTWTVDNQSMPAGPSSQSAVARAARRST